MKAMINLNSKKKLKEIECIQKNNEFLYADKVFHRTQTELENSKRRNV